MQSVWRQACACVLVTILVARSLEGAAIDTQLSEKLRSPMLDQRSRLLDWLRLGLLHNIQAGYTNNRLIKRGGDSDLSRPDTTFRRMRKQDQPATMCKDQEGRFGDCNDGLMGVWLRLIKNPEYED